MSCCLWDQKDWLRRKAIKAHHGSAVLLRDKEHHEAAFDRCCMWLDEGANAAGNAIRTIEKRLSTLAIVFILIMQLLYMAPFQPPGDYHTVGAGQGSANPDIVYLPEYKNEMLVQLIGNETEEIPALHGHRSVDSFIVLTSTGYSVSLFALALIALWYLLPIRLFQCHMERTIKAFKGYGRLLYNKDKLCCNNLECTFCVYQVFNYNGKEVKHCPRLNPLRDPVLQVAHTYLASINRNLEIRNATWTTSIASCIARHLSWVRCISNKMQLYSHEITDSHGCKLLEVPAHHVVIFHAVALMVMQQTVLLRGGVVLSVFIWLMFAFAIICCGGSYMAATWFLLENATPKYLMHLCTLVVGVPGGLCMLVMLVSAFSLFLRYLNKQHSMAYPSELWRQFRVTDVERPTHLLAAAVGRPFYPPQPKAVGGAAQAASRRWLPHCGGGGGGQQDDSVGIDVVVDPWGQADQATLRRHSRAPPAAAPAPVMPNRTMNTYSYQSGTQNSESSSDE